MENTARNFFVDEEQRDHKPVVFISSLDSFLAQKLLRSLLSQNCFVVAYKDNKTGSDTQYEDLNHEKNLLITQDLQELAENNIKIQYAYIFLNKSIFEKNIPEKLDNYTGNTTKYLYIFEANDNNSPNNQTTINKEQYEKRNTTRIYLPHIYGPEMDGAGGVLEKIEKENTQCLFITDAVHLILKVMFGFWGDGGAFDFTNNRQSEKNSEIGWRARISKEEGIAETKKWIEKESENQQIEKISTEKPPSLLGIESENNIEKAKENTNFSLAKADSNQEKIIEENREITKNLDKKIKEATDIHKIYFNAEKDKNTKNNTGKKDKFGKIWLIIKKLINKGNNKKRTLIILTGLMVVIYVAIYPTAVVLISFNQGISNLEKARKLESQNNNETSLKYIIKAKNNFNSLIEYSGKLEPISKLTRLDKTIEKYQQIGEYGKYIVNSTESEIIASNKIYNFLTNKETMSDEEKNNNINDTFVYLNKINENIAQAQAMEKLADQNRRSTYQKIIGTSDLQKQKNLSIFKYNFLKLLPLFTGLNESKKYLLLLQNNYELRPTGGFIGSYGLITFEQGKIFDVKFDDTVTIDNQLKGHVWPPTPLFKYLGQPNWYLRDSNWSPDFPTSAQKAEWFFTKETGNQVDGVIAMDVTAIQYILEKIGPIKVSEFEGEITSKNLVEKLMETNNVGEDNTSNKKDFMGIIVSKIWDNISLFSNKQLNDFMEGFLQGLMEKHIQIFMHDTKIQDYLFQSNFDGRIRTLPCNETECISDYLQIVDSNVGANKSNYYIKKNVQKVVKIENSGDILSEVILTINNSSEVNVWPQGKHKTYLRTILPFNTKILQLKIDGKIASFSAQSEYDAPKNNDLYNIDIATESATPATDMPKTSFGFYVEIPIKTTKMISILYKLPQKISSQAKNIQYQLLLQKQAGVGYDPINFSLSYPENFNVIKNSQDIKISNNQAIVNSNLSTDRMFFLQWEKK